MPACAHAAAVDAADLLRRNLAELASSTDLAARALQPGSTATPTRSSPCGPRRTSGRSPSSSAAWCRPMTRSGRGRGPSSPTRGVPVLDARLAWTQHEGQGLRGDGRPRAARPLHGHAGKTLALVATLSPADRMRGVGPESRELAARTRDVAAEPRRESPRAGAPPGPPVSTPDAELARQECPAPSAGMSDSRGGPARGGGDVRLAGMSGSRRRGCPARAAGMSDLAVRRGRRGRVRVGAR